MTDQLTPQQIPPASFTVLVSTVATQASVALGMIADPRTNKPEVNLDLAKHFVDTLVLLEQKTKGNLTPDESALLAAATSQLQMAYVTMKNKK
ncbi:hypothetical protein ETAA8_03220 [Anatilimnocola aggregata]|uniref:DUF1844 domain-containing protein n=1 Tax=Anatilimnocola aggregata TaxID=2528021 RepID=A0A517Y4T3_9BACT|nr:DUF1844 domain-containing protein [Anatilimnocola aggregata]QDU25258.1 hypothetical protein ETAA8_03220 [Anatilimnocola aggregata]